MSRVNSVMVPTVFSEPTESTQPDRLYILVDGEIIGQSWKAVARERLSKGSHPWVKSEENRSVRGYRAQIIQGKRLR